MIRLLFTILTIALFYSSTVHAYGRDYSKAEHLWKSESSKAYISGKTVFEDSTAVINLFVIDFDKRYGCNSMFKVAFLDDYEYGTLVETIPIDGGFLNLYVDNKLIYDGTIVHIRYSNGDEFGASIPPEILKIISEGNLLQIELVDKLDIIFNLNNSGRHIDSAQKSCSQE
jgi:hypothetical protein